jgi:vacuolar-type H+-ATPase subunit E/Vma4
MTTEQLTTEQRLTNLELGQARLEDQVLSNSHRLDRIVETLAEIMVALARIEGRQTVAEGRLDGLDNRLDRMEDRLDKMDAKYDKLLFWVLSLMSAAVIGVVAIAVRLVFFPT